MKATRRRERKPDRLASRAAVRQVLEDFQATLPDSILLKEKNLTSLLRAIVYFERSPGAVTRKGRKSPWSEAEIRIAATSLRAALARGTYGIGVRSFVEHYLLIPDFPEDVVLALEKGEINLFEAEQLSRLTPNLTGIQEPESLRKRRMALLRSHLQTGESGIRLKGRVDALLFQYQNPGAERGSGGLSDTGYADAPFESGIDLAPSDSFSRELPPDHFFFEYLQMIGSYMREIRPEEIAASTMERLLFQSEQLIEMLHAIHKQQNPPVDSSESSKGKKTFHL